MIFKSTLREIKQSLGRYLAILAIVALGVGFFSGLKVTKPAMLATLDTYLNKTEFYDFRIISTIGFDEEGLSSLEGDEKPDGVRIIEGSYYVDALLRKEDATENAHRIHAITKELNGLYLLSGRMPQNAGECLIDSYKTGIDIGDVLSVCDSNSEDTLDMLKEHELTVVGIVRSPMYINFERGTTSIGTGELGAYIYVPKEEFTIDYYTEVYVSMEAGRNPLEDSSKRYSVYSDEYKAYIDDHKEEIKSAFEKAARERFDRIKAEANEKILDAQKELDEKETDARVELADAKKELLEGQKEIDENKEKLDEAQKSLNFAWEKYKKGRDELLEAKRIQDEMLLKSGKELPAEMQSQAAGGNMPANMLSQEAGSSLLVGMLSQSGESAYSMEDMLSELEKSRKTLNENQEKIDEGYLELEDAQKKIDEGFKEYEEGLSKLEEEIKDAKDEIEDAKGELDDLEEPVVYALDRGANTGYACFESDSDIVASVADIFPVFFFSVAVLICMTTMNRMVEEQRGQIGVLKALGYSTTAVLFKFMFYSGSAALIGALLGYGLGIKFFPLAIWQGYNIMYNMGSEVELLSVTSVAAISMLAAILCSLGATYYSVIHELRLFPADLIRPKAPALGKRIFLEYITPLWSRMKFLHKVSARNIIRYKKRLLMMILGISGCTALVLTGLGIGDSIKGIAELQYDTIQIYDVSVMFSDDVSATDYNTEDISSGSGLDEDLREFYDNDNIEDIIFMNQKSMDAEANQKSKSISVIQPVIGRVGKGSQKAESSEKAANTESVMSHFVNLYNSKKGEEIPYPVNEGEGVITKSIAEYLKVEEGDEVVLRDSDLNPVTIKIVGVTDNHFRNYIYLRPNKDVTINNAWLNTVSGIDDHELAAWAAKEDKVLSTSVVEDTKNLVNKMMAGMDFIVYIVIMCAGALAFIVLYNLTNINITERIREIATIKVLGFYSGETAQYVFRENIILTGIGAFLGLFLGKALHAFIMYNIRIDMVSFNTYIANISYAKAILITFLFALFVNFIMFFKIEKIDMATALKSVE